MIDNINAYEQKVVTSIKTLISCLNTEKDREQKAQNEIQSLQKELLSLENSLLLLSDQVTKSAIQTAIESHKDKIKIKEAGVKDSLDSQNRHLQELKTLRAYACPHVDRAYHTTNYHKNEDFYKCLLCGEII